MHLLSSTMQSVVAKQALYYDECASLSRHLECSSDEAIETALTKVDSHWQDLLQSQTDATTGSDAFTLLAGKHMQPAHRLWLWMGGMRMSLVVRPGLRRCFCHFICARHDPQ
jgi:hypothetical protein